jgi:hypothetical protein
VSNKEPTDKVLVLDFDEESAWITDNNLKVRFLEVSLFAIYRMTYGLVEIHPKLHATGLFVMPPTDSDYIVGRGDAFVSTALLYAHDIEAMRFHLLEEVVQFASVSVWSTR